MPLFGSKNDSNFVLGINRELIKRYIDIEVAIYKLSLEDTQKNIYGEAPNKVYYEPVRIHTLVAQNAAQFATSDTGYDINRTVRFGFIKNDLVCANLVLEAGDIIFWNNDYYEVDQVHDKQNWGHRNPDTLFGNVEKAHNEFGYQISIMVDSHLTRQTRIQIREDIRPGIDDVIIRSETSRRNSMYGE